MGSVFPVALSHFPNERIAVDKFIRSVYTGIYTVSLKRWHGILRSQKDIEIIEVQKWLYVIRAYTIQTTHFRPLPEKYNFLITLLVRPNLCSGLNLYFSGPKLYILYIMVESIKWRVHVIKSKTIATNTFQARVRSLIRHEVIRTSFYFSLNIINIIIPFQFLFILPLFLSITF